MTECIQESFSFTAHFSRRVQAEFTAGRVSSDGGALLLREADRRINLLGRLASCFFDGRAPLLVKHNLSEMLAQRIYGLALGYEDLCDHEQLRSDPLLGLLSGKRDLDEPLAGKSTLNRLELTGRKRYHKISYSTESMDRLLTDVYLESHAAPPESKWCWIWMRPVSRSTAISRAVLPRLSTTATAICRCYIFSGDQLLCALLSPVTKDGAAGSLEEVSRIVTLVRQHCPTGVSIVHQSRLRLLPRGVDGLVRTESCRLCVRSGAQQAGCAKIIGAQMHQARILHQSSGQPARVFAEFSYQTHKSWSCSRRVVAKAEYLDKGENPRFVVTSLTAEQWAAQDLYQYLLRQRRDGESHQGTDVPVCRPALHRRDERQSVAAVLLRTGLHPDGSLAAAGTERYRLGPGASGYHPPQAVQDRRYRAGERTPHPAPDELDLSLETNLRASLPRPALLSFSVAHTNSHSASMHNPFPSIPHRGRSYTQTRSPRYPDFALSPQPLPNTQLHRKEPPPYLA